jgi:hydrogenase maturation factor
VVASPRAVAKLLRTFARNHIAAAVIGEVRPESEGIEMVESGHSQPLRPPARDEIARILEREGSAIMNCL